MEMFLSCLCVSVLGLGVAAVALGAARRREPSDPAAQPELPRGDAIALNRFSSDCAPAPPAGQPRAIPIELLLLQIENHVRLEQAAAESFLESPTHALLYSKTTSPFVN